MGNWGLIPMAQKPTSPTCLKITFLETINFMRTVSWPLAVMVTVAMLVIGTTALFGRDVAAVSGAIITVLLALGIAELREIKAQTNGNQDAMMQQNRALMSELGQYRRDASRVTDMAFSSSPLVTPSPDGSSEANDRL
jgi:hypothetical protein